MCKAWKLYVEKYGPIVHHATDADRKRAAGYLMLLTLMTASLLCTTMPLFKGLVLSGAATATLSNDMRHV